jgi:hypothetical protein
VVGAIITESAVVDIGIGGNPTVIDIAIEERVPDGDDLCDTLQGVALLGRTLASISLDNNAARGLVRLLNQAIALDGQVQETSAEATADDADQRAA